MLKANGWKATACCLIHDKATPGQSLSERQLKRDWLKSSGRAKGGFCLTKHLWSYATGRYRALAKALSRLRLRFALANPLAFGRSLQPFA